ncbi:MAG: hypothetical protein V1934_05590 [Methanobacteriota archaeon]
MLGNDFIISKFLDNNPYFFCEDCLSSELKLEPVERVRVACISLNKKKVVWKTNLLCVGCNQIKEVYSRQMTRYDTYPKVYRLLTKRLARIGYTDTLCVVKKINGYIKSEKDPDLLLRILGDCTKTDFLTNTGGDLEAHRIISKLWTLWLDKSIDEYNMIISPPSALGFHYSIIDGNLGNIKTIYESFYKERKKYRQARVYLILFGLIIQFQLNMDQGVKMFSALLPNQNHKQRMKLLNLYFKYKSLVESERNEIIADTRRMRNTLAHGKFITRNDCLYLYHNKKDRPEIIKFKEIINIYNAMMIKFAIIELIPIILLFQNMVYNRNYLTSTR